MPSNSNKHHIHDADDLADDYLPDSDIDDNINPSDSDSNSSPSSSLPNQATAQSQDKKRKRRLKEKQNKAKKQRLLQLSAPNGPQDIASEPPAVQADYIARLQAKTFTKLSSIELDELRIAESAFLDTSAWRSSRTLDHLPDFIIKMVPNLKTRLGQRSKDAGAPTLLFICGGALRVTDATRVLKTKKLRGEKGGDVAKLFARHIKLDEHVAYLKRAKISSAVGTPGRVGKLLCETDALPTSALTHIMLDISHRDVKKRTLLDIPETRDEVLRTVLGADPIRKALNKGKIQIVLF